MATLSRDIGTLIYREIREINALILDAAQRLALVDAMSARNLLRINIADAEALASISTLAVRALSESSCCVLSIEGVAKTKQNSVAPGSDSPKAPAPLDWSGSTPEATHIAHELRTLTDVATSIAHRMAMLSPDACSVAFRLTRVDARMLASMSEVERRQASDVIRCSLDLYCLAPLLDMLGQASKAPTPDRILRQINLASKLATISPTCIGEKA